MPTSRERLAIPRVPTPVRAAVERRRDFDEVAVGYDESAARTEASRCLRCRRPPCVAACPVGVDIVDLVTCVTEGRFIDGAVAVGGDNTLPAVCGRVCPQERQCEGACVMGRRHDPIAVGALERFVADYRPPAVPPPQTTGRRVAVVGSGPAGLACAGDVAAAGHQVTVFEALHELGGVLTYGIPEFRLPKAVVGAEIDRLRDLGVQFVTNAVVGASESLEDLLDSFDAVFVAVGAGLPRFLGIEGEDLVGVYSANEFLTRINLMGAHLASSQTPLVPVAGRPVAVFGGGNTAMDAARCAIRLEAASVTVYYRRSAQEMPARREEVAHAMEEGVVFEILCAPTALSGENGSLTDIRLQRMALQEPGPDGRRRPEPIPGSEFTVAAGLAVVAIGNAPNPLLTERTHELATTARGTLVVDEATGASTMAGVYAGGDIVTGGATVISAMGAGRRAARAITAELASSAR